MSFLSQPNDDGLCIRDVGDWSRDKHYYLERYIDGFTTAMKKKRWRGLHYVDLFAGSGMERLEGSGQLEWGSPLIAAQAPNPFDGIHVCELKTKPFSALKVRLTRLRPDANVHHGDANLLVDSIVREIPDKTLSLAFLDPYGLHLNFNTLRTLSSKRTDLLIFFPDHLDALRNCHYVYQDDPDSNLDKVLGPGADWRLIFESTPRDKWAEELRKTYVRQIRTLGYRHFLYERIMARGQPLYLLIFCSKDKAADNIWRGISRIKADSQRTFDFPPPESP